MLFNGSSSNTCDSMHKEYSMMTMAAHISTVIARRAKKNKKLWYMCSTQQQQQRTYSMDIERNALMKNRIAPIPKNYKPNCNLKHRREYICREDVKIGYGNGTEAEEGA